MFLNSVLKATLSRDAFELYSSWGCTPFLNNLSCHFFFLLEYRALSQDCGDSKRKHQAESGYFSLECSKSESNWISSASCPNHSMLPAPSNAIGASRWTPSSLSLADSELNWHKGGSGEGRCGLIKQNYTILADLPKTKRLHHQEAFEKEHRRARSPGRAEVERIFGQERR